MTFPDTALTDAFRRLVPQPIRTPQLVRIVDVAIVLGVSGSPLNGREHVFLRLGLNGPATILNWSMAATIAGQPASVAVTLDVRAGPTLSGAPSLCGSNRPALAAQSELADRPPTGWTVSLADPSWLLVLVSATDALAEVVGLTLRVAVGIDPNLGIVGTATGDVVTDNAGVPVTWG